MEEVSHQERESLKALQMASFMDSLPDSHFMSTLLREQEEREQAIAAVKKEWEEAHPSIDVPESSLPAAGKKPHKMKYVGSKKCTTCLN